MRRLHWATAGLLVCFASGAGAQPFGKNKVQYKDFDWRVLETPHFAIHFDAREDSLVYDAARMAEHSYRQLAAALQHEFVQRIPLILYASHADFQQTNITPTLIDVGTGGITELARRRVFLPFTGSYAELQHVLTHELVHAFMLDMLSGDGGFAYLPPLWVMEGLAEYLSRPKQDQHNDMWMRDAAVSGYLVGLAELEYAYDIRAYRFGQSVFHYFARVHGGERIGDLIRAMAAHQDLDKAFQEIIGLRVDEFSELWKLDVRRRHLPEIAQHQALHETGRSLVTRKSERASMLLVPSLSPDGNQIAYISDQGLTRDLILRRVDAPGWRHRLVRGDISGDFESLRFFSAGTAWSPDGRVLAFAAKAGGEDALYLLDVRSRRVLDKLTFGLDEVQTPSFSPDGEELVFVGLSGGQSDLYRVRRDGSELQRLTNDRFAVRDPQWSPDGSMVVYVSDEGPGTDLATLQFDRWHLVLLDLATGERRDITPFARGKAVSPAWSGDGAWIAFVSDQGGVSNIYVLHRTTGEVFQLTDLVTGVSGILPSSPALSWSRQSNRLVFSAFTDGGWDIYAIDDPQARLRPVPLDPGVIEPLVAAAGTAGDAVVQVASTGAVPRALAADGRGADAGATLAAPAGATPDAATETFVERRYRIRLAPDLSNVGGVVGGSDAGLGAQSLLHFSDLLGDHNLTVGLGIYGSIHNSDLLLAYRNRSRRTAHTWSVFQHRRTYHFRVRDSAVLHSEHQTYRGVRVTTSRPFNKFSRLETSLQLAGVGGRFYLGDPYGNQTDDLSPVQHFVGPGLAYVVDTAMYGSTGPILGRRLRLAFEAGVGGLQFGTLQADARNYWSAGRRFTIATRLLGVTSFGSSPQSFYVGGSHSLRGYDTRALIGNHVGLASLEFRFPLVRHLALGWPLPLELGNVGGALFADAATAWDRDFLHTGRAIGDGAIGMGPQASLGFGARANLGGVILRVDWASRFDLERGRIPGGTSISIGSDF